MVLDALFAPPPEPVRLPSLDTILRWRRAIERERDATLAALHARQAERRRALLIAREQARARRERQDRTRHDRARQDRARPAPPEPVPPVGTNEPGTAPDPYIQAALRAFLATPEPVPLPLDAAGFALPRAA
jgi:hypothetical protein